MSKSRKSWLRIAILAFLALFLASCLVGFAACGGGSDDDYVDGTPTRIKSMYADDDAVTAAGEEMNVELAEEGTVLLKNDGALPLSKGAKVSVLGIAQDCLVETSGNITQSLTDAGFNVNLTLSEYYLSDNYSADSVSGSLLATAPYGDESEYLNDSNHASLNSSMSSYNDAIIVVIARGTAGESSDRSTNTGEVEDEKYLDADTGWTHEAQESDSAGTYKHELELTATEQKLIAEAETAAGSTGKVIVLYSSSNTFELANLENDSKVNSIVWMGRMGDGGIAAIGELLSGDVNFSGKTVDEWTHDFTNDPSFANTKVTAYNDENGNSLRGTMGSDIMDQMYEAMMPGSLDLGSVDYEEDIYLGYKYYETYWKEASDGNASPKISGATATADAWYDYNVVYPYGYGLSYTSFSYALQKVYTDASGDDMGTSLKASDLNSKKNSEANIKTLYADVKVTNTGSVAGKETVEVYVETPFTKGGTEKAYLTLAGFAKTNKLNPGASETVTVAFNVQDFASYDYADLNGDGHTGYELEAGNYTIHIMESSSHKNISSSNAAYASRSFTLDKTATLDLDDFSGNEVENWFSGSTGKKDAWKDEFYSNAGGIAAGTMATPIDVANGDADNSTLLSRSDFDNTRPTAPTSVINGQTVAGGLLTSKYGENIDEIRAWWGSEMYQYADTDTSIDDGKVWEKSKKDIPSGWTQGEGVVGSDGMYDITLDDMGGVPLYNSNGEISSQWETFMNQLTWDEMCSVLNNGYHLTVAVPTIGKLQGKDENGPNYTYNGTTWVGTPFVAATWNTELANRYGQLVGNTALYQGLTGWYGPGMNTRRNQFAGRVPEYYSQDGLHAGYIGAAVVSGAESMGINVYAKHFAMYDICTQYCASATECTEQVMREIYLKPFQMAFQEGNGTATMTAFAKIGKVYAGQNYALIQCLARDEWGWTGHCVTDISTNSFGASMDGLVRAGAELPDGNWQDTSDGLSGTWDATANMVYIGSSEDGTLTASPTQWYSVRMGAMRVLHDMANGACNYNGVTCNSYSVEIDLADSSDCILLLDLDTSNNSVGTTLSLTSASSLGISYSIRGTTITFSATDEATTGSFSLRLYVDNWIRITINVTVVDSSAVADD